MDRRRFPGFYNRLKELGKDAVLAAGIGASVLLSPLGPTEAHAGGLAKKVPVGRIVAPSNLQAPHEGQAIGKDALFRMDFGTQQAEGGAIEGRNVFAVNAAAPEGKIFTSRIIGQSDRDVVVLPGQASDYKPTLPTDPRDISGYHTGQDEVSLEREMNGNTVRLDLHKVGGVCFAGEKEPLSVAQGLISGSEIGANNVVSMASLRQQALEGMTPSQQELYKGLSDPANRVHEKMKNRPFTGVPEEAWDLIESHRPQPKGGQTKTPSATFQ